MLPTLRAEQLRLWQDHPRPWYLAALAEHESCISLTHSRCWNPRSRLKTAREEGAGIPQITRAWTETGALRFDALAEIRTRHKNELQDLTWQNVYERADLQQRVLVLKMRDNYQYYREYTDDENALAFADAAYNGGIRGLDNERRACYLVKDCISKVWVGNVERFCLKSKAALYGKRSPCDINRHHVEDVTQTRAPKYKRFFL